MLHFMKMHFITVCAPLLCEHSSERLEEQREPFPRAVIARLLQVGCRRTTRASIHPALAAVGDGGLGAYRASECSAFRGR